MMCIAIVRPFAVSWRLVSTGVCMAVMVGAEFTGPAHSDPPSAPESTSATKAKTPPPESEEVTKAVGEILEDIKKRQRLVGVQAAVYLKGKTIYSEALGTANLEHEVPATRDTLFPVASIAKAFTGAAALLLWEQDRLDLDAPVQQYVPQFPVKSEGVITPRLLATGLSGIRHYRNGEKDMNYYSRHFDDIADALDLFENDPLVSAPGKEYGYTSYGYNLLAVAIQEAAGRKFQDYVRDAILRPLGLENTHFDDVRRVVQNRTQLYSWYDPLSYAESEVIFRVPAQDRSYNAGGGNLLTSADDLVRFGRAFLRSGFLSEKSKKVIHEQRKTEDGEIVPLSFGWFNSPDESGRARLRISGSFPGVQAALIVLPDEDFVAAVLTNTWGYGARGGEFVTDVPARIVAACVP